MENGDFDRLSRQLLATLDELVDLLRRFGEDRWADWIAADRQAIERGDHHGLDHFLSAFGGMGSLNDLLIHPLNGHDLGTVAMPPLARRCPHRQRPSAD